MKHISMPKVAVVAAALATATSAIPDDHDVDTPPSATRTISMEVVNNTTTPAQGTPRETWYFAKGHLLLNCQPNVYPQSIGGRTSTIDCHGLGENPFDFMYRVRLPHAPDGTRRFHDTTILIDCEANGRVTLTGSGKGVTAQVTCTDPTGDDSSSNTD